MGVHTTNGAEKMAEFVKEQGITYPVAADVEKKTVEAFAVDSFPDYYLIDRAGNLRVADLSNGDLERAIGVLLAEQPGTAAPAVPVDYKSLDAEKVLGQALADAKASNRRVLIHIGGPG